MEHLYWIVMLDNIKGLVHTMIVFGSALSIVSAGAFLMFVAMGELKKKQVKNFIIAEIVWVLTFVFGLLGNAFIPSTKQMIAIITIPKIVNNEQVQEMPDNALKLINKKLREWAEDTEIIPKEPQK